MNARNKLVTLAAAAALAAVASAATLASISGWLSPDYRRDHYLSLGRGCYVVDLANHRSGDLDAQVFDQDGTKLGEDLLPDNHPIVDFCSDRAQTVKVRVINADLDRSADYDGTIESDER